MWGYEDKDDRTSVKSQTGYAIFVMGCLVLVWKIKLQSDIATSTMESEYNALSMSMRDLLPLQRLTKEIVKSLRKDGASVSTTFKTTAHEDNFGCHRLANLEPGQMTPRWIHCGIKYHSFRSHLKPNEVMVEPVGTDEQRGDMMFTKNLCVAKYEANIKLTCGW
jgi:hypothetical protein